MAIRIQKGGSTEIKLEKFSVGLGWQVREDASAKDDFDLDVSAFMVDASGKIPTDDYLVFYNSEKRLKADENGKLLSPIKIVPYTEWRSNDEMRAQSRPVDPEISVIGSIDNEEGGDEGDAETIDMELSKVRSDIEKIIICVSIYDAKNRGQNFGQVENAYVRIYSEGHEEIGQEEIIYDLTEDFSTCASVEFVQLYRYNGTWKIKALGVGHHGEFDELVAKFT
ncbi:MULTISPECIES: TerD family protein [Bacteroidales]|uniref:TerD family protein n=1 Tax=Duncaniella freteri TaxID=2530391 RepID=A0A4Z0VC76_9BACT|nr:MULTISPECIES: TerD family protein [Bacteroidales]TGG40802.1 TerD family protein [Duncaniella freteri]